MIYYKLKLYSLPRIIFAHNFTQYNYSKTFNSGADNIELVYINSGNINLETNNKEHYIKEGSIFVIFHKNQLTLRAEQNKTHIHHTLNFRVQHDIEIIENTDLYAYENNNEMLIPLAIELDKGTKFLHDKLMHSIDEYNAHDINHEYKCSALAIELLADISRVAQKNLQKHSSNNVPSQYILSYRIKTYLAQNLSRNVSLEELSEAFNKTPNYLNFVFKEVNHATIKQYANKMKIEKVIELMLNHRMTLKESGEIVGIYDANYLSRVFKRHTGMSARNYLLNARENTASIVDRTLL